MGQREHATLTLLRYRQDGSLLFAGAHEEILIRRAATGRSAATGSSPASKARRPTPARPPYATRSSRNSTRSRRASMTT
jgi:hypothetical protein